MTKVNGSAGSAVARSASHSAQSFGGALAAVHPPIGGIRRLVPSTRFTSAQVIHVTLCA